MERRKLWTGLAVGAIAFLTAFPAFGAKRKYVTTVSLEIQAEIEPDTAFGEEDIRIEEDSNRFYVDGYEVRNSGFAWQRDTVPEIRITLRGEEDYYFQPLSTDDVRLKGGAEFIKASRQDGGATLLLDVRLPALWPTLGDMAGVELSQEGFASWPSDPRASEYQVRIYRDGELLGTPLITRTNRVNCRERMTKGETSYRVMVRPVNKYEAAYRGEWVPSNTIYITGDQAVRFREDPQGGGGRWMQEADGRWWYRREDGSYPANEWMELDGEWYFFGPDGYMQTGWIAWEGKEYYCSENGNMLTNCFTPDAYLVGEDGAKMPLEETYPAG